MSKVSTDVLLLGCAGVGKTLLVRHLSRLYGHRLAEAQERGMSLATTSTTGMEFDDLTLGKHTFTLREVGSPMLRMWHKYFPGTKVFAFVVDISLPSGVSAACMELYNLLAADALRGKPCFLILNKADAPYTIEPERVAGIFRLADLRAGDPKRVLQLHTVSALTGAGLEGLAQAMSDVLCAVKQAKG